MYKEIYNEFYKEHGAGVHSDPIRFNAISQLCKGEVLDVACGTGDLADYYKGQYTGIDVSDIAIEMAKESRVKDAKFLVQDWTEPQSLGGKQFDTIVMGEFLEHLENDDIVFENILKVVKPNSRIIISVPNGDRIPDKNHFRIFTVASMRQRFNQYGKVKFYNWLGAENRILMTIDLGQRNENEISLAMIVWNEIKGLEKTILSAIELVDKVIISVDNKSNDGTLKIAEMYGDIVVRHTWENDFAKARNFVDSFVNTKWILTLDGHEFIEQAPEFREKLKLDTDGFLNTIRMERGDEFLTTRLYKKGAQWEHAIHNAIKLEKIENYKDFIIVHDRLGSQTAKSTTERLAQVKEMMKVELLKELKIPKYRVRALFYLARYYRQFCEWKKALKYYKKFLKSDGYKGEKWLCAYEAGAICIHIGKPIKAIKFFKKAHEAIPNRWEISKQMGLAYLSFEQYKKAVNWLADSLKINQGEFTFNPEQRNDSDTWDKIGFCLFHLTAYNEAKTAWERSIELGKDPIQNDLNKKRIQLLEREHGVL